MDIVIGQNDRKTKPWEQRWRWLLDILFGVFGATVFLNGLFVMYHKHLARAEEHTLSSWLVGYTPGGGYVRRGLSGEVLWWANQLGLSPEHVIFPLCLATFAAVWIWFGVTVIKRSLNWWILPTSFCLGGLFPLTRDFCVLLLVMSMIRAHARIRSPGLRFLVVNLIGVVAIHLHEIVFFITVPILLLSLWGENGDWARKWNSAIFFAPMMVSFGLVAVFRGNADTCSKMAMAWEGALNGGYWEGIQLITGLRGAIESNAAYYVRLTINNLFGQQTAGLPNVVWFVVCGVCIFLASAKALTLYRTGMKADTLPVLLAFQAVCLVPVFPFFIDYSRLFAYAILSAYWFWLEMGEDRVARTWPFRIRPSNWDTRPRRLLLVCLLICTGMSHIHLAVDECFARSVIGQLGRSAQFVCRKSEELLPIIRSRLRAPGICPVGSSCE